MGNNITKEGLFKHDTGLYLAHAPDWSNKMYCQDVLEKWDCIYITCRRLIDENDKSAWAYNALGVCADLLLEGRRWPTDLDHVNDYLYGSPFKLTRDPYALFYALAVHLDRLQFIEVVKIPLRLRFYVPVYWAWRRYLLTGKGKKIYEWLELIQMKSHKKEYTRQLVHYRAHTARSLIVLVELGPISEQYLYTN